MPTTDGTKLSPASRPTLGGRRHPERRGSCDRIALETYRDARAAMALIREAVEDCAPPGSVACEEYLTPEFTVKAEALVRGIYAMRVVKI
jgi:hypothetical protein